MAPALPNACIGDRQLCLHLPTKGPARNKQIDSGSAGGVRSRARPQEKPQEYSTYFEDFSEDVSRERARPRSRSRCVYFSPDPKPAEDFCGLKIPFENPYTSNLEPSSTAGRGWLRLGRCGPTVPVRSSFLQLCLAPRRTATRARKLT